MSFYRDHYLKSADWKDLRDAVIADRCPDSRCECCGRKSDSLDVHHIRYRKLTDVRDKDLWAICRFCHSSLHNIVEQHPEWRTLYAGQWFNATRELRQTFTGLQLEWNKAHRKVRILNRAFMRAKVGEKLTEIGKKMETLLTKQFLLGWQLDEELI